jgi:hypothetical protein
MNMDKVFDAGKVAYDEYRRIYDKFGRTPPWDAQSMQVRDEWALIANAVIKLVEANQAGVLDAHGTIEVFDGENESVDPIFTAREANLIREYLRQASTSCYAVDQAGNTLQKDGTWQILGRDFT